MEVLECPTPKVSNGLFTTLGKGGQTVFLAQSVHALFATSEDFVGVRLMTYIPDQTVFRRVE